MGFIQYQRRQSQQSTPSFRPFSPHFPFYNGNLRNPPIIQQQQEEAHFNAAILESTNLYHQQQMSYENLLRLNPGNQPKPATEKQIRNLHYIQRDTYGYGESEDPDVKCSICLEGYKHGEFIVKLQCKHFFHPHCILQWFKMNGSCPICKQKLK